MAINSKERNKIAIFGAAAGAATPLLLKYAIMPILNTVGSFTPALSVKLAEATANPTIAVNVRESLTGINAGLSQWLIDALGFTVNLPINEFMMTMLMGAIGGALLMVLGAYGADAIGFLNGSKTSKTVVTLVSGSLIAGFILGGFAVPSLGIDLANTMIAMLVNAGILSIAFIWIDNSTKMKLVPY